MMFVTKQSESTLARLSLRHLRFDLRFAIVKIILRAQMPACQGRQDGVVPVERRHLAVGAVGTGLPGAKRARG
jgi:hypothetical protein